jgi:hypothetical protein
MLLFKVGAKLCVRLKNHISRTLSKPLLAPSSSNFIPRFVVDHANHADGDILAAHIFYTLITMNSF